MWSLVIHSKITALLKRFLLSNPQISYEKSQKNDQRKKMPKNRIVSSFYVNSNWFIQAKRTISNTKHINPNKNSPEFIELLPATTFLLNTSLILKTLLTITILSLLLLFDWKKWNSLILLFAFRKFNFIFLSSRFFFLFSDKKRQRWMVDVFTVALLLF